jgi:hypothetical protein
MAIVKKHDGVFTNFENILPTARCMQSLGGLFCHQLSFNDHWKEQKRRNGGEVSRQVHARLWPQRVAGVTGISSARQFFAMAHKSSCEAARLALLGAKISWARDYCCGEAGKISDLMTTGTAPEDGISAPTSM